MQDTQENVALWRKMANKTRVNTDFGKFRGLYDMSIERKFANGVAWMAAGNWIEQVINFAVFVLLARILGAEAFGMLAMAAAFVLFCEFLVRESFSDFLISHADPDGDRKGEGDPGWSLSRPPRPIPE